MSLENPREYPNNKQENWVAYRESPEFLRGIKKLEEFYKINHQSKLIVLAVALNVKKAGVFNAPDAEISYTEEMLSELGLFFYEDLEGKEWLSQHGWKGDTRYLIGATMSDLDEAIIASGKDDHIEFGRAMDFPETSVIAYTDKSKLAPFDDPRLTDEEKAFRFFRFSDENFEEEVVWLEQIIAAIKHYSPAIYSEVMSMNS